MENQNNPSSRLPAKPATATTMNSSLKPWLLLSVRKLIEGSGAQVSEARSMIYYEALQKYSQEAIEAATRAVIETWDKPNMMPPVGTIIGAIEEYYSVTAKRHVQERETRKILERGAKPPGWDCTAEVRGQYARMYYNAPKVVREAMKGIPRSEDAIAYALANGVTLDKKLPYLAGVIVEAAEREPRAYPPPDAKTKQGNDQAWGEEA